jgi:hypothetical protein
LPAAATGHEDAYRQNEDSIFMTEQSAIAVAPIDEAVDHVRGSGRHVILEYGDYECP